MEASNQAAVELQVSYAPVYNHRARDDCEWGHLKLKDGSHIIIAKIACERSGGGVG